MEPFIWNYLVENNEDGDDDNDDNDSSDDDDEKNNIKDGDVACLSSKKSLAYHQRSAKTARRWLARQRTSLAVAMSVWISDIHIYHEHSEENMALILRIHLLKVLCVV